MTSRRDWQLQQLGITRWSLRRPAVLQGDIALTLPAATRLIVIAHLPVALSDPLVSDVLRTLDLDANQVMALTPARAAMLPEGSRCNSWWLNCEGATTLIGAQLHTPQLSELMADGAQRRALWRQICEQQDDFFTRGQ